MLFQSIIAHMRWLTKSGWGANAAVLRITAFALVYSMQSTVLLSGVAVYTCIIETINDTLHVVTGCLLPTPVNTLPILAGIQPAELHRKQAMLSLNWRALLLGRLLYHMLADPAK